MNTEKNLDTTNNAPQLSHFENENVCCLANYALFGETKGLRISAVTDKILHFEEITMEHIPADSDKETLLSDGRSIATDSYAIESTAKCTGSLAVSTQTNDDAILLNTDALNITIHSLNDIQITDSYGELVCADYTGEIKAAKELSQEEIEQMVQEGHNVSEQEKYPIQVYKKLFGDEAVYGLGDKTGFLNKFGYSYMMWNSDNPDPHVENDTFKAMYKSFPFFIVLRNNCVYGIFFDNTYRSYFDMGFESNEYYSFGAVDGKLNYYFITGDSMAEVLSSYTMLTGRAPLPQMWTLGYQQSRWSYSSAEEVLTLAKNFKKYNIPCDAIHLDIDYMDNYKVFTTNKETFPDLQKLSDELAAMGIKLVTIIDPGTKAEKGYDIYDEGVEKGYFATTPDGEVYHNAVWPGDSVFPNFDSEEARTWWGNHTKRLTSQGIRGIWNDMNEPASFNGPLPEDVCFRGTGADKDTIKYHKELHNVYGHLMAKATYEGLKRNDGRRPFVITRACYSGSQKYTTAWTGDNQSLWTHLKMSIPQLLNLGLSGMPIVGTDIGGFGSHTTPELLCRWVEAACFAPLFRNHSAKFTKKQEPWLFDKQTLDINRKYIKLHYKFLPYLYDLMREESLTGLPVMRPLVLHYENDPHVRNCSDEYLVGTKILVAPITDPGVTARAVYLPEGNWVDYQTGERLHGCRTILKEAPIDVCPIFIKAGSILPTYEGLTSIEPKDITKLTLEFYPDTDFPCHGKKISRKQHTESTYIHYQDNGTDFAYQKGEYNLYEFRFSGKHPSGLHVTMLHEGYPHAYTDITAVIR